MYNLCLLPYSTVGSCVFTTFKPSNVYHSDAIYSWEDGSTEESFIGRLGSFAQEIHSLWHKKHGLELGYVGPMVAMSLWPYVRLACA